MAAATLYREVLTLNFTIVARRLARPRSIRHVPVLSLLLLAAVSASARTIEVPQEVPTIRAALDLAIAGDVIQLAPGDYLEPYLELASGVIVRGDVEQPHLVVVDAGSVSHAFLAKYVADARIEGLTIMGARVDGPTRYLASGAGLLAVASEVEVNAVNFIENYAGYAGGAIRLLNSRVEIEHCQFIGCEAAKGGGAIDLSYNSVAFVRDCEFTGNRAQWGGAISARSNSSLTVERSDFRGNRAIDEVELGGAFFADYAARVSFFDCLLVGNSANKGGAACLTEAVAGFGRCTVDGNTAAEMGAGFVLRGGSLVLDHTIVSRNDGEAVAIESGQAWVNATDIHGNLGGDWEGPLAIMLDQGGNIDADPLFCGDGTYTLAADSPCAAENNDVGRIGARDVGCDEVSLSLQSFIAAMRGELVSIAWQVSDSAAHEFRLTGHSEAPRDRSSWNVAFRAGDRPGSYFASDEPLSDLLPVRYVLEARESQGDWFVLGERTVDAAGDWSDRDEDLEISRIYPNPFNPRVTIALHLGRPSPVRAEIYDVLGRRIATLIDGKLPAGDHHLKWDSRDDAGRPQSTGTYLLKIISEGQIHTRKLLLVK